MNTTTNAIARISVIHRAGATLRARPTRAMPDARAPVDDAEQRTDRHRLASPQPRLELLKAPVVHPDLASAAALAAPHEHRPTSRIEVELVQIERFLDTQSRAPKHHDQAAGAVAV